MKSASITIFAILIPYALYGQYKDIADTIRIDEIVIRSTHLTSAVDGFKYLKIDTSVIKDYSLENLSDIISENSHIFIKNYGPGSIATTSFRGTGAGHTQIYWNDFNINSPMPGQADLSLIPSAMIDGIYIFHGGASMLLGNGGFGGIINIETKPEWGKKTGIIGEFGAASFGKYSEIIKIRTGGDRFQSATKISFTSAENDYPYLNSVSFPEPVTEKRLNAGLNQKDFMQEFFFRKNNSITSARVWYQVTHRNLPSNILMSRTEGSERQTDESVRATLSKNHYFRNTSIEASLAWFFNRLSYINDPAAIDSRNNTSTFFTRGKLETLVNEKTRIIVKWNNEFNLVNSNNYTGHKTRNISTFTAIALKPFSKRLNASLLISEILDNNKLLYPDFSAGMEIRMSEINDRNLKINFSRNSKAPSLNDLFWNPGGNPQLKNEYSYSGEISFLSKSNILKSLTLNTEITLFTSRIGDMIQWVPGEYSYWTPVNIAKVNTSGAESALAFIYKMNGFTMKLNCEYTFNRSYIVDANADVSSGGQLIYVPVNMFNGGIKLIFRNFYAGCNTSYTGKRYTDADNLQYLPGYTVTHLVTGFTMNKGVHSFSMSFKAENIFGKRYEVVAYYPMPGRSFLLSVSYKFGR